MADTKTLAQQDVDLERTTIRLPEDLKLRAKIAAAQNDVSMQQLIIEGLELRLSQLEKQQQKGR